MFLLVAEFSDLFGVLMNTGNESITTHVADFLFHHVKWEGLAFLGFNSAFFHVYCWGIYSLFLCQQIEKRRFRKSRLEITLFVAFFSVISFLDGHYTV